MSNLLNNKKKKLLDRGPKITPAEEFKLEEVEATPATKVEVEKTAVVEEAPKPKRRHAQDITSVRVTKQTRNKLNALIQMGNADNVDLLIDILIDEYIEHTLTKEEKKTFTIVHDILRKREN